MNFKLNLSSASRENLKGLLTVFLGTVEESKRRLGKLIDGNPATHCLYNGSPSICVVHSLYICILLSFHPGRYSKKKREGEKKP